MNVVHRVVLISSSTPKQGSLSRIRRSYGKRNIRACIFSEIVPKVEDTKPDDVRIALVGSSF